MRAGSRDVIQFDQQMKNALIPKSGMFDSLKGCFCFIHINTILVFILVEAPENCQTDEIGRMSRIPYLEVHQTLVPVENTIV